MNSIFFVCANYIELLKLGNWSLEIATDAQAPLLSSTMYNCHELHRKLGIDRALLVYVIDRFKAEKANM